MHMKNPYSGRSLAGSASTSSHTSTPSELVPAPRPFGPSNDYYHKFPISGLLWMVILVTAGVSAVGAAIIAIWLGLPGRNLANNELRKRKKEEAAAKEATAKEATKEKEEAAHLRELVKRLQKDVRKLKKKVAQRVRPVKSTTKPGRNH